MRWRCVQSAQFMIVTTLGRVLSLIHDNRVVVRQNQRMTHHREAAESSAVYTAYSTC